MSQETAPTQPQPRHLVTAQGQEGPEQLHVVRAVFDDQDLRHCLTIKGKKYASVRANAKPAPGLDAGARFTKRQVLLRLRARERPQPWPPGLETVPARQGIQGRVEIR